MDNHQQRAARRVPFKRSMRFKVLGDTTHLAGTAAIEGEILDVSDMGMKIREKSGSLQYGFVLSIKVPITETRTTVPTMAVVKWVKSAERGFYESGVMFIA